MAKPKITIIGAGNVGATTAHWCASRELGNIVLIDVTDDIPQGKALDLFEATPLMPCSVTVRGSSSYHTTAGSDIVIITAGVPRKPGMSRDNLFKANADIVRSIVTQVVTHSPNAILIIVTNPLNAMATLAYRVSGLPKQRVIGMAGLLDAARFKTFIAQELNVSVEDIATLVLGDHGNDMVVLRRCTTVAGIPIDNLLDASVIDRLIQRTRFGGSEIVDLLKTGSAYYAPGAAVAEIVESIVRDKKRIFPCSVYLDGEYGIHGYFLGVPVQLGSQGIERVIEITLRPDEAAAFAKSATHVKTLTDLLTSPA